MAFDHTGPMDPSAAKRRIRDILVEGEVVFTAHAFEEMKQDGISQAEVVHVLRSGVVEPAESERGSWRYRVRANKIYAVVSFRSALIALVVTAWRTDR